MGSTSFLGFSCPNLLLVYLNLLFLGTCVIIFTQVLGPSLHRFYFSVTYFGLACDHGMEIRFFALKSKKEKVGTGYLRTRRHDIYFTCSHHPEPTQPAAV